MLDALVVDLRYAVRRLRHAPLASLLVAATLALVIGAATTVFSLLNAGVLRTIEAPDADRLVAISSADPATNRTVPVYADAFAAFRAEQRSFSTLALQHAASYRVETEGGAFDAVCEGVTPEYFALLGARAARGRVLAEEDNAPAAAMAVVITDRLWRTSFGADEDVVGRAIKVDGKPGTIVGVTEAGFDGLNFDTGSDLMVPLAQTPANAGRRPLRAQIVAGRLAPGVTMAEARAEVLARWPAIQTATLGSLPLAEQRAAASQRLTVESLAGGISLVRREHGTALAVLAGLGAVLLAVGAVNLAALMLARALAREGEVAVRQALGADRTRLVREPMIEGVLLALPGLAAGVPLAHVACRFVTPMLRAGSVEPLIRPLTPDTRVVAVAAAAAIGMGVLVGLIPAWRSARTAAATALGGRGIVRTPWRAGRLVLATQVALSMVLAIGAGLSASTVANLYANDTRVATGPVLFTRLAPMPGQRGRPLGQPYLQGLLDRLSAIRGVDAAAYSSVFPAYLGFAGALPVDQYAPAGAPAETAIVQGLTEYVSPGFFDLFGISRLRGRDFAWSDTTDAPFVAVLGAALAERLFPGADAVGQRVAVTTGPTRTEVSVVGVVADAPMGRLRDGRQPVLFRPMLQDASRAQFPMAHVRVTGDMGEVSQAYTREVEREGRHYVRGLLTLDEWIKGAVVRERLVASMSTSAAVLAVVLACVGLYGLLAFSVTSRVREIGVRMSMGASRPTIVRFIAREAARVVVPGVVAGIPFALGAALLMRSQLYGVAPTDPRVVVAAAAVFLATGAVAAFLPARRASRIDPAVALRHE